MFGGLSPLSIKQDTLKMKTKHGKMPVVGNARVAIVAEIDNSGRRIGEASVAVLSQMLSSKEARANPPFVCVEPGEVVQRRSTETYAFAQTWISDALVYISRNAEKRLTADDIAVCVGKSLPTVEDGFRKALGRTVQQELIASRLSVAIRCPGEVLRWDTEKLCFPDNAAATAMLRRTYRKY